AGREPRLCYLILCYLGLSHRLLIVCRPVFVITTPRCAVVLFLVVLWYYSALCC
ncbi:uncharacterized protein SCHCODRAFT_01160054, partial [Schizophyllum commune H4-8]|uniref:uncharacterized protein n=1 Tax=Schizophyllum commune (strain H4-8 / FGSC 9210) TaxID=578458 RepID=UPI002160D7C0